MFKIPNQIESDRLILRTFEESDWRALHAYYSDPICTQFTLQRILSEGESWRMLATLIGHWHLRGYGPYAIIPKTDSRVIGLVGLWFPIEWPEPEIKWGLAREFWGKGYAREAAVAVREMSAAILPSLQLISLILPENDRSIKLALGMGAQFEKQIDFRSGKANIYRHARPASVYSNSTFSLGSSTRAKYYPSNN
jgi:RimJ/RimL family protein N-acetyltransferase